MIARLGGRGADVFGFENGLRETAFCDGEHGQANLPGGENVVWEERPENGEKRFR